MDGLSQQFGDERKYGISKIFETEDFLLTDLTFLEGTQAQEFKQLRAGISNESQIGNEAEGSARRLIELLSPLPDVHIAQVVIRLEAAKTFYAGDRFGEANTYCKEALTILDKRADQRVSGRRFDERLRLDLLELSAVTHELDGDDRSALTTWALLPGVALAAIGESKDDPSFDKNAHLEFVEEVLGNLSEGWFSSALSVPQSLRTLQRDTLYSLLSGTIEVLNTLLAKPVEPSELSSLQVEPEIVPALSVVLHLYACDVSRAGDYLSAEKLLSHRFEIVTENSSFAATDENSQLMHKAFIDLIRTRVDRGAISLATESVKKLLEDIPTFTQSQLKSSLAVVRTVVQNADEENISLLAPLIREQFKVTKFPRIWLGLVGDTVEIAIDLKKMKYARKLLSEVSQKVDLDTDPEIKTSVRASLMYSQINCLVKIDEQFRIRGEVPSLAKELAEKLILLLASPSRAFPDRNFHLFMGGTIIIHSLRGSLPTDCTLVKARKVLQAIDIDALTDDNRTLGALHNFIKKYSELKLLDRTDQLERLRSCFSLLSRVFGKKLFVSNSSDFDLLTSLAVQLSEIGVEYLSTVPSFTNAAEKVATKLYKIVPNVISRMDSDVLSVADLTKKVTILSSLVEAVKVLKGEDTSEYKEVVTRLESARRALHFRR
jgi:hypothetical protein